MANKPRPAAPIKKGKGGGEIPQPPWLPKKDLDVRRDNVWKFPIIDSYGVSPADMEGLTLLDGTEFIMGRLGMPFTKSQGRQVFSAATAADASAVFRVIAAANHQRRDGGRDERDIKSARRYMRNMGVRQMAKGGMDRTMHAMSEHIHSGMAVPFDEKKMLSIVGRPVWKPKRGALRKNGFFNGGEDLLSEVMKFVRGDSRFGIDLYRVDEILSEIELLFKSAEIRDEVPVGAEVFIYPKINLSQAYWKKSKYSLSFIELCLKRSEGGVWTYQNCRKPNIGKSISAEYGEWRISVSQNAEIMLAKYGVSKVGINIMPSAFYSIYQQILELRSYDKESRERKKQLLLYSIAREVAIISSTHDEFKSMIAEAVFPDNGNNNLDF